MYAPNSGYAMAQYSGGVPVTVPMQAGSDMVPIQFVIPGPQGGQPQMVMVPTAYQAQVPPKYEERGYTKMGSDEVWVMPKLLSSGT